jgi:hypothetical protein
MSIYAAMIGMFVLAFTAGCFAWELVRRLREPKAESNIVTTYYADPQLVQEPSTQKELAEAFAVAGKPKKPPFRERKKDLKAAARTERKKREEWK